ncbi:phage protein NinX family protein [Burkholderia plantarii]|uniref:phage protein NinX family protein n=1 Tax=Burkholderia plantarii TaxID=41899 RepID=UPI00087092BA|nr:phage protein NinX family protein [Burkholderia plantarii]
MRTDDLDSRELDYWTARALARDDLPIAFVALEPALVVTFSNGTAARMDARFAPSSRWADATDVLDRLIDVRSTRDAHGTLSCVATFDADGTACAAREGHGSGPNLRTALLRAFVRARFGDEVEAMPGEPHVVRHGKLTRHEQGEPIPPHGPRDAEPEPNTIGSLPRQ